MTLEAIIRRRKKRDRVVRRTLDFQRIAALPRRTSFPDYSEALTEALKTPNGTEKLWQNQAWALCEMVERRGLLASLPVSAGKTLISLLAPVVLGAKRPLLLIPANLREKTLQISIPKWAKHFKLHPELRVLSYEQLSQVKQAEYLQQLMPDLVIADECHRVRNKGSAVSRRVYRYYEEFPFTMFVGLSGTTTKRSVRDYAPVLQLALGDHSPLPHRYTDLEDWADVLDEGVEDDLRPDPGALLELCAPGETVRQGYSRRLLETEGYVSAGGARDCDASLRVTERHVVVPQVVSDAFRKLRTTWCTPGGEMITTALDFARHARELAYGFYYRWKWPNDVVDFEWLNARKEWKQFVRWAVKASGSNAVGGRHFDSELQVARACIAGHLDATAYNAWKAIRKRSNPETEAVWLSDSMIDEVMAWMRRGPGIVWVEHNAFADRLRTMASPGLDEFGKPMGDPKPGTFEFACYGGGENGISYETGRRPVAASVRAHGTGKDLQMFSRALFVAVPTSGESAEQCLDAGTEILTDRGWLGIDSAWDSSVRVAAYDKADGSIHWSCGRRVERVLGSEKMYGISNPHLDIRVTAGHRMLIQAKRRFGNGGCDGFGYREWEFKNAAEMPLSFRVPLAGRQEGCGVPLTDAELAFIGLYMTDGNLNRTSVSLFQSERYPQVMAFIERTLAECEFPFWRHVYTSATNFGPRKHPLHCWGVPKGGLGSKYPRGWGVLEPYMSKTLAPALEDMSRNQLITLLAAMWAGDGSKNSGAYAYDRYDSQTMTLTTGRKELADRLQALCVRRGLRCNVAQRTGRRAWGVFVSEDETWTVMAKRNADRPVWAEVPSDPTERVWCVGVDSGAIVTRRNGKVVVVGNCLGRIHRFGQQADEVEVEMYLHCLELWQAFDQACKDAAYIEQTKREKQLLLLADISVTDAATVAARGRKALADPLWCEDLPLAGLSASKSPAISAGNAP